MKNFDIRFGCNVSSLANLLQTFHDDTLARLDALVDDPFRADGVTNLHRPDLHRIAAVDDRDLSRALKFGHGALRNQKRTLLGSYRCTDSSILAGAQTVSGIREQNSQPDCTRLDVNMTIRE